MKNLTTRRQFIKGAVAASFAPLILPSSSWADHHKPSESLTMGFIGMGKQNGGLLRNFLGPKGGKVLAVCDVDTTRRENAKKTVDAHYRT